MDEAGVRVPADPAPPHGARRLHRLGKFRVKPYVQRPAVNVLAVLGHAKIGASQRLVGFERAKGRQYDGPVLARGGHHFGEKVDDADIVIDHSSRVTVAEEHAQFLHYPDDWPLGIAINAIEGRARMSIEKSQPERR